MAGGDISHRPPLSEVGEPSLHGTPSKISLPQSDLLGSKNHQTGQQQTPTISFVSLNPRETTFPNEAEIQLRPSAIRSVVPLIGASPSSPKEVAQTSTTPSYLEAALSSSKQFMKQDIVEIDFTHKPITFVQGKPSISFNTLEQSQLLADLKFMLVGKFTHGRPPMSSIQNFFANLKLQGKFHLSTIDKKHISIECHCKSDFYFLWLKLNWSIQGYSMRIFKWDADFFHSRESPIAPVWIRIVNLPLYFFEVKTLLSIANVIGKPILIDPKIVLRTDFSSASFCVELDVTRPLIDSIRINLVDEGSQVFGGFWASVSYYEVPPYCLSCLHIGHGQDTCKRLIEAKATRPTAASFVAEGYPVADKDPTPAAEQASDSTPSLLREKTISPKTVSTPRVEVSNVCITRAETVDSLADTVVELQITEGLVDADTFVVQSPMVEQIGIYGAPVVDQPADIGPFLLNVGTSRDVPVVVQTSVGQKNTDKMPDVVVDQFGTPAATVSQQKYKARSGSDAAEPAAVSSILRPAGQPQIWKEIKRTSPLLKRSGTYPNKHKQVVTNNSFSLLASATEVEAVSISNTESQGTELVVNTRPIDQSTPECISSAAVNASTEAAGTTVPSTLVSATDSPKGEDNSTVMQAEVTNVVEQKKASKAEFQYTNNNVTTPPLKHKQQITSINVNTHADGSTPTREKGSISITKALDSKTHAEIPGNQVLGAPGRVSETVVEEMRSWLQNTETWLQITDKGGHEVQNPTGNCSIIGNKQGTKAKQPQVCRINKQGTPTAPEEASPRNEANITTTTAAPVFSAADGKQNSNFQHGNCVSAVRQNSVTTRAQARKLASEQHKQQQIEKAVVRKSKEQMQNKDLTQSDLMNSQDKNDSVKKIWDQIGLNLKLYDPSTVKPQRTKDGCPVVVFKKEDVNKWMARQKEREQDQMRGQGLPFDDKG